MSYLYALLLLFSIIGPFSLSFDKKISFFKSIIPLAWGTLVMMLLFIPWDIYFTQEKIWGFNSDYLMGPHIARLPIEEWSFFLVIPYACIFIIACVQGYLPSIRKYNKIILKVFIGLGVLLMVLAIYNYDKAYTVATFSMLGILLFVIGFFIKPNWVSTFLIGYLFSIVPFLVINGVLTGTGIVNQVVWYDNTENLSIRVATIPIEDFAYLMLLLCIVYWVFNEVKREKNQF